MTPDQVWQAALGELQLQVSKATYDTWLRGAEFVGCDEANDVPMFVIGVPADHVKAWLEARMLPTIQRTLIGIMGRTADVRFVVVAGDGSSECLPGESVADRDDRDPDWSRYDIPKAYLEATLADLDPSSDIACHARLQRYLDGRDSESRVGLVLTGPTGTGKTTLAVCLLKRLARDDSWRTALFVDAAELIDLLLADVRDNSTDGWHLFRRACEVDVLVLDDLRPGRLTEWGAARVGDLVRRRANRESLTVITTNAAWESIVRGSLLDEPTISRLRASSVIVELPPTSQDWRLSRRERRLDAVVRGQPAGRAGHLAPAAGGGRPGVGDLSSRTTNDHDSRTT